MMTPTIVLIGADKGGVGKTTVTRTLLDYFDLRSISMRIFDSQSPSGDLSLFRKDAKIIDIDSLKGTSEVFNDINGDQVTIVDIKANSLSKTLKLLDDGGFLSDVRSGIVNLIVVHVIGATISSLNEIADVVKVIPESAKYFIVKNHINSTTFDLAEDSRFHDEMKKREKTTISVPSLDPDIMEIVQAQAVSFASYSKDVSQKRLQRGLVSTWLNKIFSEYDRVELFV